MEIWGDRKSSNIIMWIVEEEVIGWTDSRPNITSKDKQGGRPVSPEPLSRCLCSEPENHINSTTIGCLDERRSARAATVHVYGSTLCKNGRSPLPPTALSLT